MPPPWARVAAALPAGARFAGERVLFLLDDARRPRRPARFEWPQDPHLSVVVDAGRSDPEPALAGIAAAASPEPLEVIVVGSGDAPGADLGADGVLRLAVVGGRGARWGAGARAARGRVLLFLDGAAELRPGALVLLVRALEDAGRRRRADLAGPRVLRPTGHLEAAGGVILRDGSTVRRGAGGRPALPPYRHAWSADFLPGCALAVRASTWSDLGGLDDGLPTEDARDADLALRARALGLGVELVAGADVVLRRASAEDPPGAVEAGAATLAARWQRQEVLRRAPPPGLDPRERTTRGRPRLLVIDELVLDLRVSSGGERLLRVLELALAEGWHVTFAPWPWHRRCEPSRRLVESMGVEVWVFPEVRSPEALLARRGWPWDLIWVARPDAAERVLAAAPRLAPRARVVYDTVDLHFVRERRAAELAGSEEGLAAAARRERQELSNARRADVTVVVSPVEQALLRERVPDADVRVLSNIHDLEPEGPGREARFDVLFVGSFAHTPNVDAIEWYLAEVHPLVQARLPGARLVAIGAKPPPRLVAAAEAGVVVPGFVDDLRPWLERARVSIAPLRYGAGVKGKICTALAHGVPVVATPIAVEGMPLEHERDVLVAGPAPRDFAAAVTRLYEDPELWHRTRDRGRVRLVETFGPDRARAELRSLMAADGRRMDSGEGPKS